MTAWCMSARSNARRSGKTRQVAFATGCVARRRDKKGCQARLIGVRCDNLVLEPHQQRVRLPWTDGGAGRSGAERAPVAGHARGALVLLLGGVVAAVVFSAGAAVHRSLEPKMTADGSVCKPLSGDCVRLSRSVIGANFGVGLPADAQLEASGSRSLIKAFEAWAVACVPDVNALLQDAERAGFVESPVSDYRNGTTGRARGRCRGSCG